MAVLACMMFGATAADAHGKAAASGRSLADEMRDISIDAEAQGAMRWTASVHDASNNTDWTVAQSSFFWGFTPDLGACSLSYHFDDAFEIQQNAPTPAETAVWLPFDHVSEVTIETLDEESVRVEAQRGHPTWTVRTTPTIWVVSAVLPDGIRDDLYLRSRSLAERVAADERRAVALCKRG
jgi:hypothetical protein